MKACCERSLSSLFLLGGGCLLTWCAWSYYAPDSAPGPALDVETDIAVTGAVALTSQEVPIRVHNRSRSPIRVLSLIRC